VQIAIPAAAITGIEIVFSAAALLAGQTLTIGDVQLEAGSVATAFEVLPIDVTAARCLRYYVQAGITYRYAGYISGVGTMEDFLFNYPVPMRAPPSLALGLSNGINASPNVSTITANYFIIACVSAAAGYVFYVITFNYASAEL
jgi:hypothetical protein